MPYNLQIDNEMWYMIIKCGMEYYSAVKETKAMNLAGNGWN